LDDTPWSDAYYFVQLPGDGFGIDIPPSFREIKRVPQGVIFEGSVEDAQLLTGRVPWFMRIEDKQIPLEESKTGRFSGLSPGWNDPMDFISQQVSDSTITEYLTRLVDYRTRLCCTDSNTAASYWIRDKFLEFGYTDVTIDSFPFPRPDYPCDIQTNVIAVKEGTVTPDKYIVIGGHYDSITYDPAICSTDTLAPGADDDGTGTVGALEAARLLFNVETDATILFVAFGSEEQGLFGAGAIAQWAFDAGIDLKLMINMDMIGNYIDDYWEVAVWARQPSQSYAGIFAEMAETYTNLIPVPVNAPLADATPFDQLGFHNVGLAEPNIPGNPQWHSCFDEIEYIYIPYFTDVVEMATRSLLYVANVPMAPTGLNAVNVGEGTSIYLSWDPNEESDLIGYNIYYGTESGVYDSLKTVSSVGDTLTNLVEGMTYYIALTAFDGDGYESFLTDEEVIAVSAVPSPPTGFQTIAFESSVLLSWIRNAGELDIDGYNLYRYQSGVSGDTTLVAFVQDPTVTYQDTSLQAHVLYAYYVTAVDNQVPANESEPSDERLSRLATHDSGVLIVDNTGDGSGGLLSPTDEDVDTYYDELLSDYNVRAHWDVAESLSVARLVMDYDIGIYSTILWHSDVRSSPEIVQDTVTLRKFLQSGGKLWLSGWNLLQSITGDQNLYYIFEPGDFISTYVGVDSALTTPSYSQDFVGAQTIAAGFPEILLDPEKVAPITGLFEMDILLPPFDGTFPLYSCISADSLTSPYHGLPIAVAGSTADSHFVFTDFPLYFMDTGNAYSLVETVMDIFHEPVSIEPEDMTVLPRTYSISQNYPNPFNPTTTIRFEVPEYEGDGVKVRIRIYNIRGKHVRTLLDANKKPGSYNVAWDGRDEKGNTVSSGVYLYVINAGEFSSTRKMILLK
jgi:hypothetical protein